MNESIDIKKKSIVSSWQFMFFAGSVFVLMAVLVKAFIAIPQMPFNTFFAFRGWMDWLEHVAPYSAGYITVNNGIAEFSGKPLSEVGLMSYVSVFISFYFTFVLAPATYIMLRKKIGSYAAQEKRTPLPLRILVTITAGWCLLYSGFALATFFASSSVFSMMKSDNAMSQYRDDVARQLVDISFKAQQYYIYPVADGGGGNSFLKGKRSVKLDDLGFKETTSLGRFIMLPSETDTAIQILFLGNKIIPKQPYKPKDSDHLVEYELTIYPANYIITQKK
jgi:hypothetical protein